MRSMSGWNWQEYRQHYRRFWEGLTLGMSDHDVDEQCNIGQRGERVPGSCVWVLSDASYQAWWNSSYSQILWISGGPGKGKTVISTFLTETLERIAEDKIRATVLHFFCESGNKNKNSAVAILRSLIIQLLYQQPDCFHHILPDFRVCDDTALGDRNTLWRFFESMILGQEGQTYCIIDGLDGCDPESLDFLVTRLKCDALFKSHRTGSILKLIIVGEETHKIIELSNYQFPSNSTCFLRLDLDSPSLSSIADSKIERFIVQETEQLARENNYTVEMKEDVKRVLTQGANGTYLWVAKLCQELRGQDADKARETLEDYRRALDWLFSDSSSLLPWQPATDHN